MKSIIKVEVTSKVSVGKSTVVALLNKALSDYGITTKISDTPGNEVSPDVFKDRFRILRDQVEVHIEVKQAPRKEYRHYETKS